MRNKRIDPAMVGGWGVDADPRNDPTYPMRDTSKDDKGGTNWAQPERQKQTVEVLQSIEYKRRPAVFGSTTPPSGVSGVMRRVAFRYSESQWAHWLMLMLADRINVIEGIVHDFSRGKVPNIPQEMGLRSEIAHNPGGLARKALISAVVLGVVVASAKIILDRREERDYQRRRLRR
jgi:hypothetical protein